MRRLDLVDLLPSIFLPLSRVLFDKRVGKVRTFKLRRQLSDYWTYDQGLAINALDLDPFAQETKLRSTHEKILTKGIKPIILDCGANIGFSTYWLSIEYPQAKVIAVESDFDNA